MENKIKFEDKLNKLNQLVEKLQDDSIPFEEALEIYNECVKLSDSLKKELDSAIAKISKIDENGVEEDF